MKLRRSNGSKWAEHCSTRGILHNDRRCPIPALASARMLAWGHAVTVTCNVTVSILRRNCVVTTNVLEPTAGERARCDSPPNSTVRYLHGTGRGVSHVSRSPPPSAATVDADNERGAASTARDAGRALRFAIGTNTVRAGSGHQQLWGARERGARRPMCVAVVLESHRH